MASVRITDNIRSHVRGRFDSMQNKRVRDQRDKLDISLCEQAIKQKVKTHIAAPLIAELEKQTQDQWAFTRKDFRIRSENGAFEVELSEKIPVPKKHSVSYQTPVFDITHEEFPELFVHMESILERCQAIRAEYDNLRNTLCNGVLNRCTTLRQVLELWPSAIDFMPSEVVAKHRQKPPKRDKKQDVTEQIKIEDSIKAALAKERMINGSQ